MLVRAKAASCTIAILNTVPHGPSSSDRLHELHSASWGGMCASSPRTRRLVSTLAHPTRDPGLVCRNSAHPSLEQSLLLIAMDAKAEFPTKIHIVCSSVWGAASKTGRIRLCPCVGSECLLAESKCDSMFPLCSRLRRAGRRTPLLQPSLFFFGVLCAQHL